MTAKTNGWAISAATAAGCLANETDGSFWNMAQFLFHKQTTFINSGHVRELSQEHMEKMFPDRVEAFTRCFARGTPEIVLRDIKTAAVRHIDSTPTLFVNGYAIRRAR